jgi:GT2 family glycosyltransferase
VCGLLLQSRDSDPRIDSAGMNALRDGRFALRLHGKHLSEVLPLERCYVDGADGALPLFRRTFIDDVRINGQFFDERFFAHKEDWDIAWRGQLFGWCTLFEPACRALHPRQFRPEDIGLRRRLSKNIKADAVKNQWLLMLKNTPKWRFKRLIAFALPRQLAIIAYLLLFERSSLKALSYIRQHWQELRETRTIIQSRARYWRYRKMERPGSSVSHYASNPLLGIGIIAGNSGGSIAEDISCLSNNPLI